MRLNITHINKIKKADIVLNGLTVIAGNNDSGKSTVGKLLFSVIKSLSNADRLSSQSQDRIMRVNSALLYAYVTHAEKESGEKIKGVILPSTSTAFLKDAESFANDKRWVSQLKRKLEKINIVPQQRAKIIRSIDQLVQLATESSNSEKMLERAFQSIIGAEFLNSICTYNTEMSEICFSEGQGKDITIQIKENKVTEFKCKTETFVKDATLVESPLYIHLIDILASAQTLGEHHYFNVAGIGKDVLRPLINYHIKDMAQKLDAFRFSLPDNVYSPFIQKAQTLTDNITGGHFYFDNAKQNMYWKKGEQNYAPVNVASGIKAFGVLQMLLETQALDESKILIWDEPENHLHPEWQIKFASVLVELAKAGIPILISSHSPYFIQAVRYFADKLSMNDFVNYYLAEETEDELCVLEDVTDDLNRIFMKLAQPMNEIVNLGL
ncbi:AAA family ATPase [Phocaeicola coprocola]|jgi:predicted ATPase|uniref:AAA family ATPase n=1 Tax=Phocaeicola coprocola TaxID=310298 RepID=UPI00242D57F5|nr:AAA family ATPase [Phocaeicola coprocola]